MTVTEAIAAIRAEIGARDTSGTWTDPAIIALINRAQRHVWRKIGAQRIEMCVLEENRSYTAGASSCDLYRSGGGGLVTYPVEAVVALYYTTAAAAISSSNPAYPIMPTNIVDVENWAENAALCSNVQGTWRYALAGNNALVIRPIPTVALPLIIRYVPTPPTLTLGSDKIFNGLITPAHDLVVSHACVLATMKVREENRNFREREAEEWMAFATLITHQHQCVEGPRNVSPD
jgi:hypothetical protein